MVLGTLAVTRSGALHGAPRVMGDDVTRPALRSWVAAHQRERKRMGIPTQDAYAQWLGIDPANWSRWKRGLVPVPAKQGRRLVLLFDHDARWQALWLRLSQEQEQRAIRGARPADR